MASLIHIFCVLKCRLLFDTTSRSKCGMLSQIQRKKIKISVPHLWAVIQTVCRASDFFDGCNLSLGNHCQSCYQKQTSRASHPHRCALANLKVYHYLLFSSSHQSSTSGCSPAIPLGSLDAIFLTAYRNAAGVSLRPGNWLQKQLTYLDDWIWPGRVSLPLLWESDI